MNGFFNGAICVAAAVVALQYFKAWRQTRDGLFRLFAVAFLLLVIERLAFQLVGMSNERLPFVYCIRLLSFLSIAAGVIQKNLKKT